MVLKIPLQRAWFVRALRTRNLTLIRRLDQRLHALHKGITAQIDLSSQGAFPQRNTLTV